MQSISKLLVAIVALEHLYILTLEMFLWTTPRAQKAFGITTTFAQQTKSMAANQGLYNGFLAAGLLWGLVHPNTVFSTQLQLFFVTCVIIAALYGAITIKRSILLVQGLPAILAFISILLWQ